MGAEPPPPLQPERLSHSAALSLPLSVNPLSSPTPPPAFYLSTDNHGNCTVGTDRKFTKIEKGTGEKGRTEGEKEGISPGKTYPERQVRRGDPRERPARIRIRMPSVSCRGPGHTVTREQGMSAVRRGREPEAELGVEFTCRTVAEVLVTGCSGSRWLPVPGTGANSESGFPGEDGARRDPCAGAPKTPGGPGGLVVRKS